MTAAKAKRGRPPARPDRRDSILRAALSCFVERGFHGTAVPEIARRAEVAAGTLYHYFPSKEALVNELFRTWKGHVAQRVLLAFPQGAPIREQFRVMWHELLDFAKAEPEAFAFIELHNHASYLDAESRAANDNLKRFAATMIAMAQAQGLLKPLPPNVLMELVFGAFNGLLRAHYEERIDLDEPTSAAAEQACWDAVAV